MKEYKSSIIKNHKITNKKFFLTKLLKLFLDFAQKKKKKKKLWEYPVTNDA